MSNGSFSTDTAATLFVLGVPRSGTSYLHHLLNEHPGIRISYEGRLVREADYYYERHTDLPDRSEFNQLLDEFMVCESAEPQNSWMLDVMREQRDALFDRYQQAPSLAGLIRSIYQTPVPAPCWGDKCLRYDMCARLLEMWPDAKVVVLIRDPRAVYLSRRKFAGVRIRYAGIYWNGHSQWTRLHATDPSRFLVFKYEDFVQDGPGTLGNILRLLGLPIDPIGGMLERRPPQTASVDKWRSVLTPDELRTLEGVCFEEMKAWGYEPVHATQQTHLTTFRKGLELVLQNRHRLSLDIHEMRRKRVFKRLLESFRS